MMLSRLAAVLILLTPSLGLAGGLELPSSPVHTAMQSSLYADTWGEETAEQPGEAGDAEELKGDTRRPTGKKSIFKAAMYSALVPGGGQYYVGHKRTAYYFFAAEALTWIGYFSFRTYGDWRKDDMIRFAAINANAQLDNKSDDYIDLVGFYDDIRDYNSFGRAFDPERAYLPDIPEYHWEWQSDDDQRTFRDLKNASRESYRRADFMIGVAIVDRIISIIDAVRAASRSQRVISTGFSDDGRKSLDFSLDPFSRNRQVSLTLYPGL